MKKFAFISLMIAAASPLFAEIIINSDGSITCTSGCTMETNSGGGTIRMCDRTGCVTIHLPMVPNTRS